jgi:hypothetical protein
MYFKILEQKQNIVFYDCHQVLAIKNSCFQMGQTCLAPGQTLPKINFMRTKFALVRSLNCYLLPFRRHHLADPADSKHDWRQEAAAAICQKLAL